MGNTEMCELALNWVRFAPNGANLRLFNISFRIFSLFEPKCTETDLKESQICPIWEQSDPIGDQHIHP